MPWRLSSEPLSLSIISHRQVAWSCAVASGPPLLPGPPWSHTLPALLRWCLYGILGFQAALWCWSGPPSLETLRAAVWWAARLVFHRKWVGGWAPGLSQRTHSRDAWAPGCLSSCCHDHWLERRRSLIKRQQGKNHYSSPTLRLSCHVWLITSDLPFL